VLRARADAGDETCRLSAETVASFRENGFFQLLQPKGFGGLEQPAITLFRLQAVLAEADMSAGWVLANMGVVSFHLALFAPQAQADVWGGDADAILSSSNMPGGRLRPEPGAGYRLSGRWRFSSGVDHADWVMLGAVQEGEGAPQAGACVVPRADIRIVPDWDVVGLRGTGSHAVEVAAVHVPAHRFLAHEDRFHGRTPGTEVNTGPLYRLPLPQLLFRSISTASLGGLRGMLSAFLDANGERTSMMAQRIAEDPHVQDLCARVDADLAEMWRVLEGDLAEMTEAAERGETVSLARRRVFRLNATRVADRCFRHAADLLRAAGASALYRGSPLLRFFNDMLAARQHAANQYELHARNDGAVLFGQDREDMLL
jgi:3-hydroxy-9,10-secoandrosta-1,3,5(10)-triene-9,17-dione monooxygenase